ncbi:GIN domain-containing protein [Bacteroidota bacterium]
MKTSLRLLLIAFIVIIVGIIIILSVIKSNLYKENFDDYVEDYGETTEQIRELDEFSSINAKYGIEVIIIQDTFQMVKVITDELEEKDIVTRVDHEVLYVYSNYKHKNRSKLRNRNKVYVTIKNINDIKAYKGTLIKTQGLLKGKKINFEFNDGAIGVFEVNLEELDASLNAGAILNIEGEIENVSFNVVAGGIVKAHGLKCINLDIKASAGGIINAGEADFINIKANSGAIVKYNEESKIGEIDISSGAQVMKY